MIFQNHDPKESAAAPNSRLRNPKTHKSCQSLQNDVLFQNSDLPGAAATWNPSLEWARRPFGPWARGPKGPWALGPKHLGNIENFTKKQGEEYYAREEILNKVRNTKQSQTD